MAHPQVIGDALHSSHSHQALLSPSSPPNAFHINPQPSSLHIPSTPSFSLKRKQPHMPPHLKCPTYPLSHLNHIPCVHHSPHLQHTLATHSHPTLNPVSPNHVHTPMPSSYPVLQHVHSPHTYPHSNVLAPKIYPHTHVHPGPEHTVHFPSSYTPSTRL